MKTMQPILPKIKKTLIKWVKLFLWCVALIFLISWFFPKKIPFIDTMRVSLQQSFFSSISALRYPNISANNSATQNTVLKKTQTMLAPWDIIFSYRAWFVTNDFIDGKWKHASVYLWNKNTLKKFMKKNNLSLPEDQWNFTQRKSSDMLIIDSTEHWVTIRSLKDLTYLDDILIVRPMKSQTLKDAMMITLIKQLWKPYNYDFDINDSSSIYCAQLIHQALTTTDIHIPYTSFAWRAFLYPQDIVDYIFATGINAKEFTVVTAIKNVQSIPVFYNYDDMLNLHLQQIDQ